MGQYTLWVPLIAGLLALLWHDIEKWRWLGGDKDENAPIKDGTFWLFLALSMIILRYTVLQIGYLINLSIVDPTQLVIYANNFFGIALIFALVFVLLIKGFINPSLNFVIALICNISITIISWELDFIRDSEYVSPFIGLIVGVIIENILKYSYKSGNRVLWELPPKVWKTINDKWFVLVFTIIFIAEMFLQLYQESITTLLF